MADEENYPWTRRPNESSPAYEAFRTYMRLGLSRTLKKTAEELGKQPAVMGAWSSKHNWRDRCAAYDTYVTTAEVDGMKSQITATRQRHIELADKLLDHLSNRLDSYITQNDDPSIRWTQAFAAGCKVHTTALTIREDEGSDSKTVEKILELIERVRNIP
jgi:hypothetical protein